MLFSYGTNAALDRINSVWGGRSRGKIELEIKGGNNKIQELMGLFIS